MLGYYKGNGANVARVIPVYGLKFAFNDYFKNMIAPGVQRPSTSQLIMVCTRGRAFRAPPPPPTHTVCTVGTAVCVPSYLPLSCLSWVPCRLRHGLQAGTLAGLVQQCTTLPMEVIRTRLSVGVALNPPMVYKGILDCARTMIRSEGPSSLCVDGRVCVWGGGAVLGEEGGAALQWPVPVAGGPYSPHSRWLACVT